MKAALSIKTLLRTPVKTILTFLLLAAISGAFYFGVSEYMATTREMDAALGYYKGVGAVSGAAPLTKDDDFWRRFVEFNSFSWLYEGFSVYSLDYYLYADERVATNPYGDAITQFVYGALSAGDIEAIANLPYVTRTSNRYMGAGVSDSLERADYRHHYFNFTERFVLEVTIYEITTVYKQLSASEYESMHLTKSEGASWEAPVKGEYITVDFKLSLDNAHLLAGDSKWFYDPGRDDVNMLTLSVHELSPDNPAGTRIITDYRPQDDRAIMVNHVGEDMYNEVYSHDFLESITLGGRYLVIGRYDSRGVFYKGWGWAPLSDPSTFDWFPQLIPLDGLPENYLELDEFAPLRLLIEISNADRHTFDVVYTDDMSAIMRFSEGNMLITAGRMLTDEDVASGNRVCVMNSVYMRNNNLNIGDVITLSLGDKLFEQNPVIGAVASVRERYADNFTEVEFEIVGAYRNVDTEDQQTKTLHWTYSDSAIFVPLTCMPMAVPENHAIKPAEFTFIIDDPRDIAAFLNECKPIIENELGLTLFFSDMGWSAVEPQLKQAGAAALLRFLLLSLAMLIAIGLTVYLFITRKRKEYAIMRALGTPVPRTNRSLYLPLGLLAVLGFAVGSTLASILAGGTTQTAASQLAEAGVTVSQTAPAMIMLVCIAGQLAALALITAFSLNRNGKKPPLELLQSGAQK